MMADDTKGAPAFPPDAMKEIRRRLGLARLEKSQFLKDFQEVFKFTMPHRVRPGFTTGTGGVATKPQDAGENFSSIGAQVTADFASDFSDTFLPEHTPWALTEVSAAVPDALKDQASDALKADTAAVFEAIAASNFYEAVKIAAKDLSISAAGIWIDDPGGGAPINCRVVPLPELLIYKAASGGIGTRFWEQNVFVADLPELFPGVALPAKIRQKKAKDAKVVKSQGCWRDYTNKGETAWHVASLLDDEPLQYSRHAGLGSGPLLVMRWDPDPVFSWGIGCGINALPDFRERDEVAYLGLKGLARAVDPNFAYTDDSIMDFEGGLGNGEAIPMMKGSEIHVIESKSDMNAQRFSMQDNADMIRKHYYLDEPVQRGLTPPTLGQWLDQSTRKQRRLATPAAPLWPEFISEAYYRFRYLLVQRGQLNPQLKVGGKEFPLRPVNPLKRAALQEQAAASERFLTMFSQLFGPQALLAAVGVGKTAHDIRDQLNATGVNLNDADSIDQTLQKMQQAQMAMEAANKVAPLAAAMQPGRGTGVGPAAGM